MSTPTKFTQETREKILQALSVGASQRTAAAIAGIDAATLTRWLQKGREADQETNFGKFYAAVQQAEAQPRVRALGILYKELPDNPALAWKFIERREPGFAPPMPNAPASLQPQVVIQMAFADGSLAKPPWIRQAEVIDAEEVTTLGDGGSGSAASS